MMSSSNREVKAKQLRVKTYKSGLKGHSKRPKYLAKQKVDEELINLIKSVRINFSLGSQGISYYLLRVHNLKISTSTIWRMLKKEKLPRIKRYIRIDKIHRYSKLILSDRVQIDVTKIGPKCYQFTAVDDCTRLRVLRLYPNKKAESSVDFLGQILDSFEFPIQRIQTDWGQNFSMTCPKCSLHQISAYKAPQPTSQW